MLDDANVMTEAGVVGQLGSARSVAPLTRVWTRFGMDTMDCRFNSVFVDAASSDISSLCIVWSV